MHKLVTFVASILGSLLMLAPSAAALDLGVSAAVMAPLPPDIPVITSPGNNTSSTGESVEIIGSCPVIVPSLIVVVFRQGDLVGSAVCQDTGRFSIRVGLVLGANTFVPRFLTITGEYGGEGQALVVNYTKPEPRVITPVSPVERPVEQGPAFLKIRLSKGILVFQANKEASFDLTIDSNENVFDVAVDWGDGSSEVYKSLATGTTTFRHTYSSNENLDRPIRGWVTSRTGQRAPFVLARASFAPKPGGGGSVEVVSGSATGYQRQLLVAAFAAFVGVAVVHFVFQGHHLGRNVVTDRPSRKRRK